MVLAEKMIMPSKNKNKLHEQRLQAFLEEVISL
jgi:hypothetical protein